MTSQQKTGALLPCPFCGGAMQLREALWPSEGDVDGIIHASPTDCPMPDFTVHVADGCASVTAAWNERLAASRPQGAVGREKLARLFCRRALVRSRGEHKNIEKNIDALWPQYVEDADEVLAILAVGDGWREIETAGCHGLDNEHQVFFYEQDFYVLSNFSAFEVKWSGFIFKTSEHLYHWLRFTLSENGEAQLRAGDVKNARSAHDAFKIAQANKRLQKSDWDDVKVGFMRAILREKAKQHEYVRRKLLATGDRELIENSWRDGFWGWGPNRDGQNMLGKLWMEVRAELHAVLPAAPPAKQGAMQTQDISGA